MAVAYTIGVDVDEAYAEQVDAAGLEAAAAAVLAHEGLREATLSLVLTSDEAVQELNRTYRGLDAPTDVLSFSAQEGDEPLLDLPDALADALEAALGDVVIAVPYAARQAARFGNSLRDELLLLTVHGVLHLLGYDHATPDEEAALWALQEEILAPLGVRGLSQRAYDEP